MVVPVSSFVFFNCDALDEMGTRIDELEKSINDLKAEMGPESSLSPLSPAKAETKSGDGSA